MEKPSHWPHAPLHDQHSPVSVLEEAFRRRDEVRALERAAPALLALVRTALPHMKGNANWTALAEHALSVADGKTLHLDPEGVLKDF